MAKWFTEPGEFEVLEIPVFVLEIPVAVLEADIAETFKQAFNLLGRQLWHCFPAFTQAQPLHEPVLLHLQQATMIFFQTVLCTHLALRD